jgi:hypothetical protein
MITTKLVRTKGGAVMECYYLNGELKLIKTPACEKAN